MRSSARWSDVTSSHYGQTSYTVLDVGVGRVFRILTSTPTCCQSRDGDVIGASETWFACSCRVLLHASNCLAVAAAFLYALPHDRGATTKPDADYSRIVMYDAFGPLGIQFLILVWLAAVRYRLLRLESGAQEIARTTGRAAEAAGDRWMQQQQQPGLWRGSLTTGSLLSGPPGASFGTRPGSRHATDPQAPLMPPIAPAVDLEKLKFHRDCAPTTTTADGRVQRVLNAAELVHLIAYRGAQPGLYTFAFRGVPRLPESHNYEKCLTMGLALGMAQCVFLRGILTGEEGGDVWGDHRESALDVALWWVSCSYFLVALALLHTLLALLALAHRQQYLLMRRFTSLLVRQRALKHNPPLPYVYLNCRPNLASWYAVREFLLAHTTLPNVLRVALDTTAAAVVIIVVATMVTLMLRVLFQQRALDLMNKLCLSFCVLSILYLCVLIFYGVQIQAQIQQHSQILSHVQWEISVKWNRVREELRSLRDGRAEVDFDTQAGPRRTHSSDPSTLSTPTEGNAKKLWALREYVLALQKQCESDPGAEAKILGASFESLRWFLIVGLLTLNLVLFFAIQNDKDGSSEEGTPPVPRAG